MTVMHSAPTRVPPIVAWLLAAFFLLAQGAALSHEYDHALHKHEAPCAQHFFAGSLDAGAAAKPLPPVAPVTVAAFGFFTTLDLPSRAIAAYRGRAPPRSA